MTAHNGGQVADRGPELMVIVWVLTGLSTITVVMRLASRGIRATFGWNDSFMLVALVRPIRLSRNHRLTIMLVMFIWMEYMSHGTLQERW